MVKICPPKEREVTVNWLTTKPLVLNSSQKLLPAEGSELRFCSLFGKKGEGRRAGVRR